jgi:hypothetical protein
MRFRVGDRVYSRFEGQGTIVGLDSKQDYVVAWDEIAEGSYAYFASVVDRSWELVIERESLHELIGYDS